MSAVIETQKLTKVYEGAFRGQDVVALKDLDLTVYGGEIFGYAYDDGFPAPKARVYLRAGSSNMRATADGNGYFRFTRVPAGKVTISASIRGGGGGSSITISKTLTLQRGESLQ